MNMFPTTVGIFKYKKELSEELNYIKSVKYIKNLSNLRSKNSFLLRNKKLKKLKTFFEKSIEMYAKQVLGIEKEICITQAWSNQNTKGTSHHTHYHPNSIISGVFYLKVNNTGCPIVFSSSNRKELIINELKTDYNYGRMALDVQDGDLILFPSNLEHQVPPNDTEITRYSVSFNTFTFKSFGSEQALTIVKKT